MHYLIVLFVYFSFSFSFDEVTSCHAAGFLKARRSIWQPAKGLVTFTLFSRILSVWLALYRYRYSFACWLERSESFSGHNHADGSISTNDFDPRRGMSFFLLLLLFRFPVAKEQIKVYVYKPTVSFVGACNSCVYRIPAFETGCFHTPLW